MKRRQDENVEGGKDSLQISSKNILTNIYFF